MLQVVCSSIGADSHSSGAVHNKVATGTIGESSGHGTRKWNRDTLTDNLMSISESVGHRLQFVHLQVSIIRVDSVLWNFGSAL